MKTRESQQHPPLGTKDRCPRCGGTITLGTNLPNRFMGRDDGGNPPVLPDGTATRLQWRCENDSTHDFYLDGKSS